MRPFAIARVLLIAVVTVVASGVVSRDASAAPRGLPDRPLDIELREADVRNVFKLLGEVSGRKLLLDPCVHGVVDIKLQNAPLPLVFDVLASKLSLLYVEEGSAVAVRCVGKVDAATEAKLATRVSLAEKEAPLPEVLARLASSAGLEGVDYRASARPSVDIALKGVKLATALDALAESSGVAITIAGGKLVAE